MDPNCLCLSAIYARYLNDLDPMLRRDLFSFYFFINTQENCPKTRKNRNSAPTLGTPTCKHFFSLCFMFVYALHTGDFGNLLLELSVAYRSASFLQASVQWMNARGSLCFFTIYHNTFLPQCECNIVFMGNSKCSTRAPARVPRLVLRLRISFTSHAPTRNGGKLFIFMCAECYH